MELLPVDVLTLILVKLPVKRALRLARVCKRYRAALTSNAYTRAATKLHIVHKRGANAAVLPREIPQDCGQLLRDYFSWKLERDYLHRYMEEFASRVGSSGYYTRNSCRYEIHDTRKILTDEELRCPFRPDSYVIAANRFWPELSLGGQYFQVTLRDRHKFQLSCYGPQPQSDLKRYFKQPNTWLCSFEHPRQMRVARGCLKRVLTALCHQRGMGVKRPAPIIYGSLLLPLPEHEWLVILLMSPKYTIVFAQRHNSVVPSYKEQSMILDLLATDCCKYGRNGGSPIRFINYGETPAEVERVCVDTPPKPLAEGKKASC